MSSILQLKGVGNAGHGGGFPFAPQVLGNFTGGYKSAIQQEEHPKKQKQQGLCQSGTPFCPVLDLSPLDWKQWVSGARQALHWAILCIQSAPAQW